MNLIASLLKAITDYKGVVIILGIIVFFILLTIWVYRNHVVPKLKPSFVENREFEHDGDNEIKHKEATLMYFYADWCPHCKAAKPHVDEIKSIYDTTTSGKRVNDYAITFEYVNCSDDSNTEVTQKMDKYGVEGFPTIKLKYDGKIADMDAKPDKETIELFLNTMLK
uniref:Thioredoxin domain-containing protein n=1 Tax=viral metagenome TaxID=1070528 RepID=A0A6C0BTQ7_9ZZZZ